MLIFAKKAISLELTARYENTILCDYFWSLSCQVYCLAHFLFTKIIPFKHPHFTVKEIEAKQS